MIPRNELLECNRQLLLKYLLDNYGGSLSQGAQNNSDIMQQRFCVMYIKRIRV